MRDSRRDDVGLADGFDDLPDAGPALRNEAEVAGVKVEHRAVVFDQPQMACDDDDELVDGVAVLTPGVDGCFPDARLEWIVDE